MTPTRPAPEDPIAARLAALPEAALDPRFAAEVQRAAQAALAEPREGGPLARASRLWHGTLLPAALVACAVVYAWDAVRTLERIYVAAAP